MKLFWIAVVTGLIACGNNREAEYPEDMSEDASEEASDDRQYAQASVLREAQTEEAETDGVDADTVAEEAPVPSGRRVPPVGQLAEADPAPLLSLGTPMPPPSLGATASAPRNLPGTDPQKHDLMFSIPPGWEVRAADLSSAQLFHRRTKSHIRIWLGDDKKGLRDQAEELRQEAVNQHGLIGATPVASLVEEWTFSFEAKDHTVGSVFVIPFPVGEERVVVIVLGSSPYEYSSYSSSIGRDLIKSMYLF